MDGVYLVGEQRHVDLTSAVIHEGEGGETSQMIKGVASGQGRGVFQGLIRVEKGADKTDARMRHDALLLSERAEIDAKPELEIFADDVSCAHGNTVGALDDAALFYARQRGLPEHEARVLLTEAFVGAVVERIEHEGAREVVAAIVARKLEALT
jgi:Fe-S cluster assembly protein SufD